MAMFQGFADIVWSDQRGAPDAVLPSNLVKITTQLQVPESRLILIGIVIVAGIGLRLIYSETLFGLATSAVAENPLVRALSRKPRVLIADELSLGLAPTIVIRLLAAIRAAADDGLGVLLVEQHVHQALGTADRAYVMRRGQIELSDTSADLLGQLDLIEGSYLQNGSLASP